MSAHAIPTHQVVSPYGAYELKQLMQRHWTIAFGISVTIHILILFLYVWTYSPAPKIIPDPLPRREVEIWQPPKIPGIPQVKPGIRPQTSKGVPVPVPEARIADDRDFARQEDLAREVSPADGIDDGIGNAVDPPIMESEKPQKEFEISMVEKVPMIVKAVAPQYPLLALRAEIQGTVWIKMLVDRDGKPIEFIVLKSDAEIFNDAALEAARQFVFTPGLMTYGPVRVWVVQPFRFTLK